MICAELFRLLVKIFAVDHRNMLLLGIITNYKSDNEDLTKLYVVLIFERMKILYAVERLLYSEDLFKN